MQAQVGGNIKVNLIERGYMRVDQIRTVQNRIQWRVPAIAVMKVREPV
jgi:hypothetical protein